MVKRDDLYCVIMAGGIGSRFWPLSRSARPKQFIDILGTGRSLIQLTFSRISTICPVKNIFVVTSLSYRDLVYEQLPEVLPEHVLLEPMRRNTAPCIAYASYAIKALNPNAVVMVTPSDHLIEDEAKFLSAATSAINFAASHNALLTLGMKPSRAETGYGYIQVGTPVEGCDNLFNVKTFTEKPNAELAQVFLKSGEFFWNSGIFVWHVSSIIKALEQYLPEINSLFSEIAGAMQTPAESEAIERVYSVCRNISIDYGVMEKAENVFVVCAEFGWSDLGTWGSLYSHVPQDVTQNAVLAKHSLLYDTHKLMLRAPADKLVLVQGLDDYIVVDTDDVLLICKKSDEQKIKDFVNDVQMLHKEFS